MTLSHEITFRNKAPEDEPFCFQLFAEVQAERLGWAGPDDPSFAPLLKITYMGFSRSYAKLAPPSQDQIVLRGGTPVGRLIFLQSPGEIRLADIAVRPGARKQGIGSFCVQRVVDLGRERNLPVRLQTAKGNSAYRLYNRLGFAVTKIDELDVEMEIK